LYPCDKGATQARQARHRLIRPIIA
jgi:hypothetical protein